MMKFDPITFLMAKRRDKNNELSTKDLLKSSIIGSSIGVNSASSVFLTENLVDRQIRNSEEYKINCKEIKREIKKLIVEFENLVKELDSCDEDFNVDELIKELFCHN